MVYADLISREWLPISVALVLSTFFVMAVTGWVEQLLSRRRSSMFETLTAEPLFGIGLTLFIFVLAQRVYLKSRSHPLLTPVAVTIVAIIAILLIFDIPYQSYQKGGRYILFLLGPSVVALAVPLYRKRSEIYTKRGPILAGVTAGALVSIVSASGLAWLLGGSREVVLSMAPKSVTTPIAIALVEKIGGFLS